MKNILLSLIIILPQLVLQGQNPHLYWRFANPTVYNEAGELVLDFNIELSCDAVNTYFSDLQVYLNYNAEAFGTDIISMEKLEVVRLDLLDDGYWGTPYYNFYPQGKTGRDCSSDCLALFIKFDFYITSPYYFSKVPQYPEWGELMKLKMKILDPSQSAGIEFAAKEGIFNLMDGGEYYLDATHPFKTKYGDPPFYECYYENDLLDFPLTNTTLDLKVFLQGPYDQATNKMGMEIVSNGLFPTDQPFQPPLPYYGNMNPVWYYTGTESVATAPQDAVDWILLELRDAPNAASATPATTVGKMAALLLNDGSVVATNGFSRPVFPFAISQGLFTVIYHRNHIPVMNATPMQTVSGIYEFDYTTGSDKVFGGSMGYAELEPGAWGLASADGNADGQAGNNDKNDVWLPEAGQSGYLPGDFNLDCQVNNTDKIDCWIVNTGKGSQVPE